MLANVQQRLNLLSSRLFKENVPTSVGKWLKNGSKKSKMLKFFPISDNFSEFSFEIGKLRYVESFEKVQMIKLDPTHVYDKTDNLWSNVSSE